MLPGTTLVTGRGAAATPSDESAIADALTRLEASVGWSRLTPGFTQC